MGPNCSIRALQERIKKLRKDGKAMFDTTSPKYTGCSTKMPITRNRPGRKPGAAAKVRAGTGVQSAAETDDSEAVVKPKVVKKGIAKKVAGKVGATPFSLLFPITKESQKRKIAAEDSTIEEDPEEMDAVEGDDD